ncbi:hypothetical protein HpMMM19_13560 [Helicobacter pylori]
MGTEPLFYLRNKACLDLHAYTQPLGKEVYGLEAKISIPHLKLRQKQIDALLAHDITKLYCTK